MQDRDAVTLHCSSCGAPFPGRATACPHCGSEITIEERDLEGLCGSCGARMVRNARFCMRCGIAAPPQPTAPLAAAAPCPRCRAPLRERALGQGSMVASVVECGRCGGLWIAPDALDRLCEGQEAAQTASSQLIARPPPLQKLDVSVITYLRCPTCREQMSRRNFGGGSGVIVDVCGKHGVWLDHSELEKVLAFARGGGLERARQREVERLRREAQDARDRRYESSAFGSPLGSSIGESRGYGLGDLFLDLLNGFRSSRW
jgi:Zn-finger nucleic acid-binding protein